MSTYTAPTEKTLRAGLRQSKPDSRKELIDWVSPNFNENDYFVTLTFRPNILFDEAARSLDVRHFLNRLNRKIYGKQFDRGLKRLKCFPVFEFNNSDGLHVHMLLERPADESRLDRAFEATVIEVWTNLNNGGIPKAQDVRDTFDIKRLLSYMSKQIRTSDKLIRVDANNIHWH